MENKKTIVIGASANPERYSHMAVLRLQAEHIDTKAIGIKKGFIGAIEICTERPNPENVDTITLYINRTLQPAWYDYILTCKPRRLIFNPGTENPELKKLAEARGIEAIEACTLVMLSTGQY